MAVKVKVSDIITPRVRSKIINFLAAHFLYDPNPIAPETIRTTFLLLQRRMLPPGDRVMARQWPIIADSICTGLRKHIDAVTAEVPPMLTPHAPAPGVATNAELSARLDKLASVLERFVSIMEKFPVPTNTTALPVVRAPIPIYTDELIPVTFLGISTTSDLRRILTNHYAGVIDFVFVAPYHYDADIPTLLNGRHVIAHGLYPNTGVLDEAKENALSFKQLTNNISDLGVKAVIDALVDSNRRTVTTVNEALQGNPAGHRRMPGGNF